MATSSKIIALHGSYFGYNFGDTLLCALFAHWIKQANPATHVYLPLANKKNAKAIGGESHGLLQAKIPNALVYCGGGYFGEPNKPGRFWPLRNFLRHGVMAEYYLKKNVPFHVMGIGAGPLAPSAFRVSALKILPQAKTLIVRDEESKKFLTDCGLNNDIPVATDAALSLTEKDIPDLAKALAQVRLSKVSEGKKILLLHLKKVDNAVLTTIKKFLNEHDNYVPVAITDSKPRLFKTIDQQHAARQLETELADFGCLRIEYDADVWGLVALINKADIIITNKLHVGIVGTALRKFVISLPTHQKTPRFYKQIGLSERCLMPEDLNETSLMSLLKEGEKGKADWTTLEKIIETIPYKKELKQIVDALAPTAHHHTKETLPIKRN